MNRADKRARNEKPLNVLLVDDNPTDVKITLRVLERTEQKTNVFTVNSGEEALDFIRREGKYKDDSHANELDLILLDIEMPRMDGFQVLKRLKSEPLCIPVPIIILTSAKDQDFIVESYSNGAAGFITKPLTSVEFMKAVEGIL